MKKLKICFVMPSFGRVPCGGYKVIYEYANRLQKDGNSVTIAYAIPKRNTSIIKQICIFLYYAFIGYLFSEHKCNKWFHLDINIKQRIIPFFALNIVPKYLRNSDFICATAVDTAYYIDKINISPLHKIYLIQDYEKWMGRTDEYVTSSYKLNMKKVTISDWLYELVKKYSTNQVELIYNGFDFSYFKLSVPIESRDDFTVCMLYHVDERKRCEDSFKALEIVKRKYPMLKVNIFGTVQRPDFLPEWYRYYQKPNKELHNKLYNEASIFIASSKAEGMALPPAEAMICGCALVCTDIPGFAVYAKNEKTALLNEVYNYEQMAVNICRLISDRETRNLIAKNGNAFISTFTWDSAFEKILRLFVE